MPQMEIQSDASGLGHGRDRKVDIAICSSCCKEEERARKGDLDFGIGAVLMLIYRMFC